MWLNRTAQTALRAVMHLAAREDDRPVPVGEIAAALGSPRNYLSKTLHLLSRSGVLRSSRGPHGGFRLELSPAELTLARVVAPFEPVEELRCLMGRGRCGDADPCLAHHRWSHVAVAVERFFQETTVADLLGPVRRTAPPSPSPHRSQGVR